MKRGIMKSMMRMAFTMGGSIAGAKVMGWVFDNVIEKNKVRKNK